MKKDKEPQSPRQEPSSPSPQPDSLAVGKTQEMSRAEIVEYLRKMKQKDGAR